MATDVQKKSLREKRLKQIKDKEEKFNIIKEARKAQKTKVDYNVMKDQLSYEELEKFHKPVTEQLEQATEKLTEINVKQEKILPALESMKLPQITSEEAKSSQTIPLQLEAPQKKELLLNPDKDMDIVVINHFKLLTPGEILDEIKSGEIEIPNIQGTIDSFLSESLRYQRENVAKMNHIKDKESENYREYRRVVDALSAYRKRIKLIPTAVGLRGSGFSHLIKKKKVRLNGGNIKFYSSPDELISRLNLLIAGKQAGNNSVELRNETVAILDELLKTKILTNEQHNSFYKFINE